MMALHHAFKTAALGGADGVHKITGRKQRRGRRCRRASLPWRNCGIPDAFDGRAVVFLDVAEQRLGQRCSFWSSKPSWTAL
jgi:hypothetical protein